MKNKKVDVRDLFIEEVLNGLNEDNLIWYKGWNIVRHQNIVTGKDYKGFNQMLLMYYAYKNEYESNVWGTFKQLKEKDKQVSKGSKGKVIMYYTYYDLVQKKNISIMEYNMLMKNGANKEDYRFIARDYNIFNLQDTENYEKTERTYKDYNLIEKYLDKNKVILKEIMSDQAYYSPSTHEIVMPLREQFISEELFYSTLLHEIAHSTKNVVLRDIPKELETKKDLYAFEELVAEISSVLMACDLGIEIVEIENHKAYLKSWNSAISNDNQYLFKAISNAQKIVDYIMED